MSTLDTMPQPTERGARPLRDIAVRPVISAWSVVSPFGFGSTEYLAGLEAGRRTAAVLDRERWPGPVDHACLVPGLVLSEILGKSGTRSMDRLTGLAVTAVGQLLGTHGDQAGDRIRGLDEHTALVLGTGFGSAQSIMDFTRDSLTGDKPFFVDPARFPNTVMNCAAGRCAIWHRLKGPNATVAGGRASGLLALQYALRLQRSGHAEAVLCGAAEEFSTARAWLDWHVWHGGETRAPLGEGCAVVLLERAPSAEAHGRSCLAEVLALWFGVYHEDEQIPSALAACVRQALGVARLEPRDAWAVAPSQPPSIHGHYERMALTDVFGAHRPLHVPSVELIGDTSAASAAFQLTAVLAMANGNAGARGQVVLLTSVDDDGVVGCALLRLGPA